MIVFPLSQACIRRSLLRPCSSIYTLSFLFLEEACIWYGHFPLVQFVVPPCLRRTSCFFLSVHKVFRLPSLPENRSRGPFSFPCRRWEMTQPHSSPSSFLVLFIGRPLSIAFFFPSLRSFFCGFALVLSVQRT